MKTGRVESRIGAAVLTALLCAQTGCASNAVPARDPSDPSEPQSSEPSPHGDGTARAAGWVSLSFGAEAAIVAGVTSGMMLHEKDVRDAGCDAQKMCSTDGFNANEKLKDLGGWNAAAWIVAGVGLGVGAVLLWTNPPREEHRTSVSIDSMGTGAGVGVRSSF